MKKTFLQKKVLAGVAGLFFSCAVFAQRNYDQKVSANITEKTQEGEACLAIDPLDSNKMVIGYMEISDSGLNFRICTSDNAGVSWTPSAFDPKPALAGDFPGLSKAGGGDIVLAYDKTGKLYCSWIYVLVGGSMDSVSLDSLRFAMYWAESIDNGRSFTMQSSPDRFIGRGILNNNAGQIYDVWDGIADREWMACDLSAGANANKLYCGFLLYPFIGNNTGLYVRSKSPSANTFSSKVPAYLGTGQMSNVLVDNNGALHYVFIDFMTNVVSHCSSSDGGSTFSAPHQIATGFTLLPDSDLYVNYREEASVSFAIDGKNNLHIVWQDFPGNTFPNAYYSYSTDGGQTWSAKFNLSSKFGNHPFMPAVSAKGNKVSISANVLDDAKKSEYYIMTSLDEGKNFGSPVKVSSGVTDYAVAKMLFMGDYSTSVRTYCTVFSTWTDNRANGAKQYISSYNECNSTGMWEIVPVNSSYFLKNLYPNPTREILAFDIVSEKPDLFSASIIDISGRVLLSQEFKAQQGTNNFSVDVHSIAAGNYLLKIVNQEQVICTRAVVKR